MAIEDHAALDAALEAYIAEVHEVMSVVGLKAPGVDYGPEVSRINAAKAEIDSKLAELRGDIPEGDEVETEEQPETLPLPDAVEAHAEATGDAAEGQPAPDGADAPGSSPDTATTATEAHAAVLGDPDAGDAAEPVPAVEPGSEPVPATADEAGQGTVNGAGDAAETIAPETEAGSSAGVVEGDGAGEASTV